MKKSEKTPKTTKSDSEQKTRVLLENMYSDIKKIAEGQVSTDARLSKIEKIVPELIEVKSEVKAISMAVMTLNSDLKSLHNDVKDLKEDVKEVKSELHSVKMIVTTVSHENGDHEKRIKKVEEKVFV